MKSRVIPSLGISPDGGWVEKRGGVPRGSPEPLLPTPRGPPSFIWTVDIFSSFSNSKQDASPGGPFTEITAPKPPPWFGIWVATVCVCARAPR